MQSDERDDVNANPAPEGPGLAGMPCSEVEIKNAPCWCGEENPEYADEADGLESRCGGTGHLNCYCGGDLCCCHHHGQAECFGCPDCEEEDDDDYYDE